MRVYYCNPLCLHRLKGTPFRNIVAEDDKVWVQEGVVLGTGRIVETEGVWARVEGDVEGEGLVEIT